MAADCAVGRVRINRSKNGGLARAAKASSENVAVSDCTAYGNPLITN